MAKLCDPCEILKTLDPKTKILETDYWIVAIGNNHAYLGRGYVTLKQHKASLSELSRSEWMDFQNAAKKLEKAYKNAFGAEPLNWGAYMNNAFREEPFNPHVHWHIYPRYNEAHSLDGITFDDPLFGEFYDHDLKRIVSDETMDHIATELRKYL